LKRTFYRWKGAQTFPTGKKGREYKERDQTDANSKKNGLFEKIKGSQEKPHFKRALIGGGAEGGERGKY